MPLPYTLPFTLGGATTMEIRASKVFTPPSTSGSVTAVQATSTGSARAPVSVTGATGGAVNRPANPGAIVYGGASLANASSWAHPGALVVAGRSEYTGAWVTTVANGGGTVLIYLDCIVWNTTGRYHDKLFNASEFGAAVPKWPGNPNANSTGDLADFRTVASGGGGVLQSKLSGVLNLAISENPKISGFFLDDCGTRSFFPNFDWTTIDREAYRAGAIAICQTARAVADANDLFLMVNGTWGAQSTSGIGDGGYPTRGTPGCSLVDGGFVENHSFASEQAYWTAYANSTQWASATPRNKSYIWFQNTNSATDRNNWVNANVAAFASSSPYDGSGAPWTTFTDFHIPHR